MGKFLRNIVSAVFVLAYSLGVLAENEFPVPKGFKSGFENVNGLNIHFVEGGSGPLVLMVHGFAQSWYEWHQLMPELAKKNRVVAIDLPGLGMSDRLKASYTGQDVSSYIYDFAKRFSLNAPFSLVAHDIGVWATYPMLVNHQKEVAKVAYLESVVPDDLMYTFPAFEPKGESTAWHFSFFSAENALAETLISGKEKLFFSHFIKKHAERPEVFTDELLALYAKSYSKPGALNAAFEYYRALPQSILQNRVLLEQGKLTVSLLAVSGDGQGGLGQTQIDLMKRYAKNVQGHVLPGCGHWLMEECPVSVQELIVDFFNKK